MSQYQDVKLLMGLKAYEYLEAYCLSSDDESVQDMVKNPSSCIQTQEFVLISWDQYDWDRLEYQSVYDVERALKELDKLVQNDPQSYPLEEYYYKIIRIGNGLTYSTRTNDEEGIYTSDFYVQANFSM